MKIRNILAVVITAGLMTTAIAGCDNSSSSGSGSSSGSTGSSESSGGSTSVNSNAITVVSREDGSGTRSAFVELLGIVDDSGNDATVSTAEINNSTNAVMMSVSSNPDAIGYISLGSLNDTVKAVKVDGVEPTVENVKSGAYTVARPFEICYKEDTLSDLGRDFISYIMSAEGQQIISDNGYIAVDTTTSYTASGLTGTLALNGSTSVGPVMEKLAEQYEALNSGVTVQIQQTGSGSGIQSTISGACDIGMSSRALKDTELAEGLTETKIADDGIAVIVNSSNTIETISSEQIKEIYLGNITNWFELG